MRVIVCLGTQRFQRWVSYVPQGNQGNGLHSKGTSTRSAHDMGRPAKRRHCRRDVEIVMMSVADKNMKQIVDSYTYGTSTSKCE